MTQLEFDLNVAAMKVSMDGQSGFACPKCVAEAFRELAKCAAQGNLYFLEESLAMAACRWDKAPGERCE